MKYLTKTDAQTEADRRNANRDRAVTKWIVMQRSPHTWSLTQVSERPAPHPADGLGEVFTMDEFEQSLKQ